MTSQLALEDRPIMAEHDIGVRDYQMVGAAVLDREVYAGHLYRYSHELAAAEMPGEAQDFVRAQNEHDHILTAELNGIRTQIRDMTPRNREVLDGYLATFTTSHRGEPVPITSTMIAESRGEAGDHMILQFLHEHDLRLEAQHQSERWQKAVFEDKMEYIAAQEELITAGWISPHARVSQQEVIDTPVVIGDVWHTLIHDLEGGRPPSRDCVIIAQGTADNLRDSEDEIIARLDRTGSHEYDHVQFVGEGYQPHWFKEALAEHISASRDGGIHELDPQARLNTGFEERQRLIEQRQLLNTLLKGPYGEVPLYLATLAHTSDGPGSKEWQRFNSELDRVWGTRHVLAKISRMIDMSEAHLRKQDLRARGGRQSRANPGGPSHNQVSFESQSVVEVKDYLEKSPGILYDDAHWQREGLHYQTQPAAA